MFGLILALFIGRGALFHADVRGSIRIALDRAPLDHTKRKKALDG